jgi:hypothetical protein
MRRHAFRRAEAASAELLGRLYAVGDVVAACLDGTPGPQFMKVAVSAGGLIASALKQALMRQL